MKKFNYTEKIIDANSLYIILDIDNYIKYIHNNEDGELYSGPYEDPEFYNNNELKIEAISHEYQIEFYLSEKEKNEIENKLGIQLKDAIS